MIPRTPRERLAAVLWLVLAIFIGNGIYDVLVARGIKEVLYQQALSEAAAGPAVPLAAMMRTTVHHATAVGLLWAGMILGVGVATIRLVRSSDPSKPPDPSVPPDLKVGPTDEESCRPEAGVTCNRV